MTERRTRQQIYYDLLTAIMKETPNKVKATNVQARANLSYNKAVKHLSKMKELNLIDENYTITSKGYCFYNDYTLIINQANKLENMMGFEIFPPTPTTNGITIDMTNKIKQMTFLLKEIEGMSKDWSKAQEDNT